MSLSGLMRQEVQSIRRSFDGASDVYGTATITETTVETVCHVQPVGTDELENRAAGQIDYRGFFPAATTIGHLDRIVLASGLEAEVVGPPREWTNPRTLTVSHLEVSLRNVTDEEDEGS
jgi:hypothetical protein